MAGIVEKGMLILGYQTIVQNISTKYSKVNLKYGHRIRDNFYVTTKERQEPFWVPADSLKWISDDWFYNDIPIVLQGKKAILNTSSMA